MGMIHPVAVSDPDFHEHFGPARESSDEDAPSTLSCFRKRVRIDAAAQAVVDKFTRERPNMTTILGVPPEGYGIARPLFLHDHMVFRYVHTRAFHLHKAVMFLPNASDDRIKRKYQKMLAECEWRKYD